jgi:TrmH RNA methyltransferase
MGKRDESKVYGVNACRALFLRRAQAIVRVYIRDDRVPAFRDLLAMCARVRLPYRVVPDRDLEAVTESRNHEGICIVAHARSSVSLEELVRIPGPACLLGMAGVGNPHNVGAILRTGVHFGVRGAVFLEDRAESSATDNADNDADDDRGFRLSAAASRTAQGAAEWLDLVAEPDPSRLLHVARTANFTVAATSSHDGVSLYAGPLPPRLLLLVGAEDEGLPEEALQAADLVIAIPGTGHVESLNVAAATAVILGEHWRQRAEFEVRPAAPAGSKSAARGARPTRTPAKTAPKTAPKMSQKISPKTGR